MNLYLVVFDRAATGRYKEFQDEFLAHSSIYRWWHYIKSAYIVGSDLDAIEISRHFRSVAAKYNLPQRHFVVEIDLENRHGWLPKKAWKWIHRNTFETE